eukprot:TRINITY_DN46687_c0_g1_i1.p1 TRINITY_DN46687_c0_g1~~TRINITY_DN46687_c0_g1_i1.p1  ORF type:complete len:1525 (+),score=495.53 TRINITY_DN46687_c0_g1_i1:98-4672(+)
MADQRSAIEEEEWLRDRAVIVTQSHNLILALRTNALFSSKQRFGDFGKEGSHRLMTCVKALRKELLNTNKPLIHSRILQPFIEVSKSEETTGPITGVALSGLATFLEMRLSFIDLPTIVAIASAALEVKSEVADAQSHEAVLGRILQVLKACVCHPLGVCLPEDVILNILQGCLAIAMHGAPSELLRHTADATTNDMVTHLYECVVRGSAPHSFSHVFEFIVSMISTDAETITKLLGPGAQGDLGDGSALPFKTQLAATKYAGLTLVYHSLATLKGSITEERCGPILAIVQNELCRALLSVSNTMDNVVVIAQMLHTVQLVAMYCGDHIGPQLLAFLLGTYLKDGAAADIQSMEIKEVILETLMEFCSMDSFPVFLVRTYDLDIHYPNVFEILCKYLASQCYPCSANILDGGAKLTSLNLCAFNTLIQLIKSVGSRCTAAYPQYPSEEQRQLLDKKKSLQTFARQFLEKPKNAIKNLKGMEVGADGRNIFGVRPESNGHEIGKMLFEYSASLDKKMLGEYISEGGLDPEYERHGLEGESKEAFDARQAAEADTKDGRVLYCSQVREGFIAQFSFKDMHLVAALRLFLSSFLLPGEAQRIDRLMEEFATRWHQHNTPHDGIRNETINPFVNSDAAFVFSFSVIMLNTDLHSKQVENKMTHTGFKRNNRGTNGGKDIPPDYQDMVYDDILDNEIKMKDTVTDIASEDFQWKMAVLKSRETGGTVGPMSAPVVRDYDAYLFNTMMGPAISALSAVTEAVDEDQTRKDAPYGLDKSVGPVGGEVIINSAMHGFYLCGTMAAHFRNTGIVDKLVIALCKFTDMFQPKFGPTAVTNLGRSAKGMLAIQALFNIVNDHGECMRNSWVEAMGLVLRIYLLGCLPEQQVASPTPMNSITDSTTFPSYVPSNVVSAASSASTCGSPVASGPQTQSFYECPVSPIMSVKPYEKLAIEEEEKPASGWFSLTSNEEIKKQQQAQNKAAMSRVCRIISECKISAIMEEKMKELSDDTIVWVVVALIKNSGVEVLPQGESKEIQFTAHPSSVHTTVFSIHLLADLLVSNSHRYHIMAEHIDAFYANLLVTAAKHICSPDASSNKQEIAYWISVGEHVVVSLMRILVRLATAKDKSLARTRARLNGLSAFSKFHDKVFGPLVARHVASALTILLKSDALNEIRDAETWKNLIVFTNKCGLLSKNANLTVQCFEILQCMTEQSSFAWPDNVPNLVQGLINLYLFYSTNSEDPDWEHVSRPGSSPSGAEPVNLKVVPTLTRVRDTLTSCSSSLKNPSPKWTDAWLSILNGFAAVVASHASSRGAHTPDSMVPRERSDALIALQRSILASETVNLPVSVCYDAITKVLVELVKKLCGQENRTQVEPSGGGLLGRFSPTMILGAALPDSPAPAAGRKENSNVKGIDDLQTRVLALMCRAFLHFTENAKLASTPNEFMKLWRMILGLLYAYYTRPPPQSVKTDAGEAVKEAVCEQTKNMINVLASLPSPDLRSTIPDFWPTTRELVVKISPTLEAHLNLFPGAAQ